MKYNFPEIGKASVSRVFYVTVNGVRKTKLVESISASDSVSAEFNSSSSSRLVNLGTSGSKTAAIASSVTVKFTTDDVIGLVVGQEHAVSHTAVPIWGAIRDTPKSKWHTLLCADGHYYHPDFEPIEINGIKAKVVKLITDTDGTHSGLPTYSNTSTMYLRLGPDGSVVQAKLYQDRHQSIDFDWGHEHRNKGSNRDSFPKGVVHVQTYTDTKTRDSNNARLMSDAEISLFGPVLRHFCQSVKFRP